MSPAPGDIFGSAVAISRFTAIVGARGVHNFAGAAYVFVRSRGAWHRQAILPDPGQASDDEFGSSVAVAGQTAIVGATGVNNSAGAAYIYARSGSRWHLQASLPDPSGITFDVFGSSVAVWGGTAVVGAINANNEVGAAYVYVRSGTTWHRQAALTLPGGGTNTEFGTAVAISGGTALIGAPGDFNGIGAAYVYVRSGTRWHRQARLIDPVTAGNGQFGLAVGLTRSAAVIGAFGVRQQSGAAWIYTRSGTAWNRRARLTNPGGRSADEFGAAVAISRSAAGLRVLIGAPVAGRRACGTAYDFARLARRWREKAKVANPHCTVQDNYGTSVALSGRTAFIGAPNTSSSAGAVYFVTIP